MPTGTVKFFNQRKGYGFITAADGGKDTFVHISSVEKSGLQTLKDGTKISFELAPDRDNRMCATALKVL